jgi:hypothetical protein
MPQHSIDLLCFRSDAWRRRLGVAGPAAKKGGEQYMMPCHLVLANQPSTMA